MSARTTYRRCHETDFVIFPRVSTERWPERAVWDRMAWYLESVPVKPPVARSPGSSFFLERRNGLAPAEVRSEVHPDEPEIPERWSGVSPLASASLMGDPDRMRYRVMRTRAYRSGGLTRGVSVSGGRSVTKGGTYPESMA